MGSRIFRERARRTTVNMQAARAGRLRCVKIRLDDKAAEGAILPPDHSQLLQKYSHGPRLQQNREH